MFTKPLEYIFLPSSLQEAYEKINKASNGIDEVDFIAFENDFAKNIEHLTEDLLQGHYAPEPLKKIEIDKPSSDEKRPIALSSIKDKIVQRVLYENLNPYFDKLFSDKSYAYRPDKSTIKAINRVSDFLNKKKRHIVKTDIDDFFESIDHEILLQLLRNHIKDNRIVKLIALFMQMGGFFHYDYEEHLFGVHQGDILSPLLSNIYLNEMDRFLEDKDVAFVRYADDFVMLFEHKNEAYTTLKELKKFLHSLHLRLEEKKTYIVHISEGFSFLGVHFAGRNRYVDNDRFLKTISRFHTLAKTKTGFMTYINDLNTLLQGLKNYYLKIVTKNEKQHRLLQETFIQTLSHKIYLTRNAKKIKSKKEFRNLLAQIKFSILFEYEEIKDKQELAIAMGLEKYLANKSYSSDVKTKIEKKKNQYAKKFALDTTLHIQTHGVMLGISKNKFTIKRYGKVQQTYPLTKVQRIILEGKSISLSSDVIKKCADNAIAIDFIDTQANPYASLITYKASLAQNIHKQAALINTPKQLELAASFIRGKAKNQINYLKYLNKYHRLLDTHIDAMEKNAAKIKTAATIEQLMGVEGSISASYWDGIRLVLEVPFERRITKGAKDIVNSSLNYGYAILYSKVQNALVLAGLSLHVSFLHTLDKTKPTLTFDLIEEFRSFIVDRVIISMLNKDEPIKLDKDGLLTQNSRKLIAKNIKEKLGSYTMWKKRSHKIENIIQTQAYLLARVIDGEEKRYKPFIGKY